MSVSTPAIRWTYDDYCAIPEDRLRHEILDGVHVVTPAPSIAHQRAVLSLAAALKAHFELAGSGEVLAAPVDVLLDEHTIVQPDLVVVLEDSGAAVTDANIQGPPDLVVEVLSPGTRGRDEAIKRRLYERFGVRAYWRVDLEAAEVVTEERTGTNFGDERRWRRDETLTSPLLPKLELELDELFR